MAKIFYGLAGEGRGHATRAATLVELLRGEHELHLFAPNHAYELLEPLYRGSEVSVQRIPGPEFGYTKSGHVSKVRTSLSFLKYLWRLRPVLKELKARIRAERPALCITDFDPAIPRAAQACGVPYVSVDHQNFLRVSDLSHLPQRLRLHARLMSTVVARYYSRQAKAVVSSFYFPPLREGFDNVVQTGVLLRPHLLEIEPADAGHLCVYLRRFAPPNVLDALRSTGRRCRIYGPKGTSEGNLEFCPIDERRFVEDLASSSALVTTAGNQLVGEAMWLGKPVLGLPEDGNEEQEINARFLGDSGAGAWHELTQLSAEHLAEFLGKLNDYRARIDRSRLNGNDPTLEVLNEFLVS